MGKLPGEAKREHTWRTRADFLDRIWGTLYLTQRRNSFILLIFVDIRVIRGSKSELNICIFLLS